METTDNPQSVKSQKGPDRRQAAQYRKTRTYRCGDPLYQAAMKRAAENGESLTGLIIRFLEHYTGVTDSDPKRSDRGAPR